MKINNLRETFKVKFHTISYIAFAIFIIILFVVKDFNYESNDDISLEWTFSGYYDNNLQPYSLFNNFIFGFLINGLYRISDQVNWYGYSLIFLLSVSCLWLIKSINKNLPILNKMSSLFVIFFFIYLNLVTKINWTSVSFMIGFSGINFLIIRDKNTRIADLSFSIILVFISLIIRFEVGFLLLTLFFIYFIYYNVSLENVIKIKKRDGRIIFSNNIKINIIMNLFKLLGIIIALIFLVYILGKISDGQSNEWKIYKSKFKLIAPLGDNPSFNLYYTRDKLQSAKWSENDFWLFKNFYFDIPGCFNENSLRLLKNSIPNDKLHFKDAYTNLNNMYDVTFLLTLIFLLIILCSFLFADYKLFLLHIISIFITGFILWYLSGSKLIFKDRIIYPIICFYLMMILTTFNREKFVIFNIKKNSIISLFVLSNILSLWYTVFASKCNTNSKSNSLEIVNYIKNNYNKNYILNCDVSIPFENFDSRIPSKVQMKNIKYLPVGWINLTPKANKIYKKYNLNGMNDAILNYNTIILVKKTNLNQDGKYWVDLLSKLFVEHYRINVEFNKIDSYKDYNFYKVIRKD